MTGRLQHSPAEIIREMLIEVGSGSDSDDYDPEDEFAWPIFKDNLPDTENGQLDNAYSVNNTEGRIQGKTHVDGVPQEKYGIQIVVRANMNDHAYIKARRLISTLSGTLRYDIDIEEITYRVQAVTATSPVIRMGQEVTTRRWLYSCNFVASILVMVPGTGS